MTSLGKRLGGLSGVTGTDRLARYASEIRYLAGEDPVLHQALVPPTVAGAVVPLADAEAEAQDRLPGSAIDRRVATGVSRELAMVLSGAPDPARRGWHHQVITWGKHPIRAGHRPDGGIEQAPNLNQ